jgi:hypothetical protein
MQRGQRFWKSDIQGLPRAPGSAAGGNGRAVAGECCVASCQRPPSVKRTALSVPLLIAKYMLTLRPAGGEAMQSGDKSVLPNNETAYDRREMIRSRRRKNSEPELSVSWLRMHGTKGSVQSRTVPPQRDGTDIESLLLQ